MLDSDWKAMADEEVEAEEPHDAERLRPAQAGGDREADAPVKDEASQAGGRPAPAIYRIAQEASRNVAKHAEKTHVKMSLAGAGDRLQLQVMNFAVGFDQESNHSRAGLGVISMQERARPAGGVLTVQPALGKRAPVTVEVPLEHHGR